MQPVGLANAEPEACAVGIVRRGASGPGGVDASSDDRTSVGGAVADCVGVREGPVEYRGCRESGGVAGDGAQVAVAVCAGSGGGVDRRAPDISPTASTTPKPATADSSANSKTSDTQSLSNRPSRSYSPILITNLGPLGMHWSPTPGSRTCLVTIVTSQTRSPRLTCVFVTPARSAV
jgi:hypothetical protein